MTREQVIQSAREVAEKAGWPWEEPIVVEEGRRFYLFGRRYWRVTTNTKYAQIGRNVHVQMDDLSGQVLSGEYVPTLRAILSAKTQEENFIPARANTKETQLKPQVPVAAAK